MKNVNGETVCLLTARALVVGMLAAVVFAGIGAALPNLSNSGGGNWSSFREITVKENSGSALTDYQILLQLSGNSFPTTTSDGADIRFTDAGGTELSYWIENWDYGGKSASIWVKVPNIPGGGSTILNMYYGNPSASAVSNGGNTFIFFDDFNNNVIDPNKWGVASGGLSFSEQNKQMQATYNSGNEGLLPAKIIISEPFIAEGLIGINGNSGQFAFFWQSDVLTPMRGYVATLEGGNGQIILWKHASTSTTDLYDNTSQLASVYAGITKGNNYFVKLIGKPGELKFLANNKLITSNDFTYSNGYFALKANLFPGEYVSWDDVRIRKYASLDPTVSIGAEQPVVTPTTAPSTPPTTAPSTPPTTAPSTPPTTSPTTPNPTPAPASITGRIIDAKTGDPVQGATISIDGVSSTSDANGNYDQTVAVGKHNLSVSMLGYETMTRPITVPEGGTMLDISLKPASGNESWLWIVIILVIVIVAAGIIYLLYRKKKLKEKEEKERREKEEKERKDKEEREKKEREEKERREKEEKERKAREEKKRFCMFCHAPLSPDAKFCPACGKKQEEKTRFCMNCGAPMPNAPDLCPKCSKMPPSDVDTKTCKNCGEVIPAVAKFCSACGARQPE